MNYYKERLDVELRNILNFWNKYAIHRNTIAPEVNFDGSINANAPLGTIFISRLIYGVSSSCIHLKDFSFKLLADRAYKILISQMTNPNGGYYCGINNDNSVLHDSRIAAYVQASVLHGLCEYFVLSDDKSVKSKINRQIQFIETILKCEDSSYNEGFTVDWESVEHTSKTIQTHLLLLETYTRYKEITDEYCMDENIKALLDIILNKFIDPKSPQLVMEFTQNWDPVQGENWLGHTMGSSWLLCRAARAINSPQYISRCNQLALELCENTIERGFDKQYGGIFNRFDNKELVLTDKEWWPQTECVLALMNAYSINGDKKYLSFAIRILEYIDNTFTDTERGEWYDSVSREGIPYREKPKLHFWKSMYHNTRYCIETSKYLENLYKSARNYENGSIIES